MAILPEYDSRFPLSTNYESCANCFSKTNKFVRCPRTNISYQLQEQIGSGSAASVFRARRLINPSQMPDKINLDMSQEFAAKVFDLRRLRLNSNYDMQREKLFREMMILKDIHHPCIVNLLHVIETENELYFIMELVKGGELFYKIIENGSFSEDETRYIVIQILSALQYLHEKNIMHRDLKPENILLANEPRKNFFNIKLADFGLARFFRSGFSEAKTFVGTPQYWAPEVIDSASGQSSYGPQADLWSLGCIIYVMLAGSYPFDSRNAPVDVLIKRAEFTFRYPRFQYVSDNAKHLIKGLLTVDPKSRMTVKDVFQHPWIQTFSLHYYFTRSHMLTSQGEGIQMDHLVPSTPESFSTSCVQLKKSTNHENVIHGKGLVPSDHNAYGFENIVNSSCNTTTTTTTLCHSPTDFSYRNKSLENPSPSVFTVTCLPFLSAETSSLDPSINNAVVTLNTTSRLPHLDKPISCQKKNQGENGEIAVFSCLPNFGMTCNKSKVFTSEKQTQFLLPKSPFPQHTTSEESRDEPQVESLNSPCYYVAPSLRLSSAINPVAKSCHPSCFHSFHSISPVHFYHVCQTVFSISSQPCKPNTQSSERMFHLDQLLCHQLSIMQRVNLVYLVLRYSSQAEKRLRDCILEKHGIQLHCIQIIQQFESTCYSVLALFPDLFWAVTEHQVDFGIQLLEDVFSWILGLKTSMLYHQQRIEIFLRHIYDLLELIHSVKRAADQEILSVLNRYGVHLTSMFSLNEAVHFDSLFFDPTNPLSQHTGCVREVNTDDKTSDQISFKSLSENSRPSLTTERESSKLYNQHITSTCITSDCKHTHDVVRSVRTDISESSTGPFSSFKTTAKVWPSEGQAENLGTDYSDWNTLQPYYSSLQSAVYEHLRCIVKTTIRRMVDDCSGPFYTNVFTQSAELSCFLYKPLSQYRPFWKGGDETSTFHEENLKSSLLSLDADVSRAAKELVDLLFMASHSACAINPNFFTNHRSALFYPLEAHTFSLPKCFRAPSPSIEEKTNAAIQVNNDDSFAFNVPSNSNFVLPSFKALLNASPNSNSSHDTRVMHETKPTSPSDNFYHFCYYNQIFLTSKLLSFALEEVRQVEHTIRQCLAFWVNLVLILERLGQIKTHTTRLLRYSSTSPLLEGRLEEILTDYKAFWLSLKDQLYHYSRDAKRKMSVMNDFSTALCNAAERIDTALATH